MRRLLQSLVVLSLTPVGLALPVVSRPVPAAKPVRPVVAEHAVRGIDAVTARTLPGWGVAAGPTVTRPLALTAPVVTKPFSALGVTWDWRTGDEVEVSARVRQDGRWTGWHSLDADPEHGPDARTPDVTTGRLRGGTAPWFTGPADGYQVRLAVVEGGAPRDVRVALVDPGSSPADGSIGADPTLGSSAYAAIGQPSIVTRAQWGADESLRGGSPSYSDGIKLGFVHHTDTSNSYSPSQAAAMVRSVYAFHTQSRGWSDIGYNFLVDKYGRIFEGRYGGVSRPVIGAHTGGFNTDTFGVSLLGRYTSVAPSASQLLGLEKVFAWKLGLHYVNPLGRTTLMSRGGPRYDYGELVTFNNVSGHRDAGYTACPGYETYRRLGTIRSAIKSYMGASLYYPKVSTTRALYRTTASVTVTATTPGPQYWRLDVRNSAGTVIRRISSGTTATTSIAAKWNFRDTAGALVTPDSYRLLLSSWTSKTRARAYNVGVKLASPLPSGVAISYGGYHALVDNGGLGAVTAAMAAAVRPSPALTSYPVQRSEYKAVTAPARDGLFVRDAATGAQFVVVDGQRRPIAAEIASALGLTAPVPLPPAVLLGTPEGPAWTDAARHPDGQIVKGSDGTAWRIESGVRRPFTSTTARNRWAKGFAVPAATAADLALPLGAPLAPPEGTVLRTATGGAVVSDGLLRAVPEPNSLGYPLSTAPVATSADLAALSTGEAVAPDKHPSGTLLWTGKEHVEILGRGKRVVDKALLAADARSALVPSYEQLRLLMIARWTPPTGLAGRAADGTVRVVDNGRVVTLASSVARDLGYGRAELPALEAADFGALPVATALANAAAHPAGSLVHDGSATWLVDAGTRRAVAPSLVATWRRPVLPATSADLALPVGVVAPAGTGAWVVTADGSRWLVDRGARRYVSPTVARRLGLDLVAPIGVVAEELAASTVPGPPVA